MGAEGPLFLAWPLERMKGPEAPLDEKSYRGAPLIVLNRTLSYWGSPELMVQSSKRVRGPLA